MDPLALFFSASGRIPPRTFALAVIVVYLGGFASQMLLAAPVIARGGLVPFALTQAILTWSWFAVHAKRLRDSGRGSGGAVAIAILYGLALVLLVMLLAFVSTPAPSDTAAESDPESINLFGWLVLLYIVAMLF